MITKLSHRMQPQILKIWIQNFHTFLTKFTFFLLQLQWIEEIMIIILITRSNHQFRIFTNFYLFFVIAVMNMKVAWVPAKVSRNSKWIFYLGILAQAKMTASFLMSIHECKLLAECVLVLLFTGEWKNCQMTKS